MIQLKSLIKEEVLNENMVSVLKPPVRKAKSTIYGYINLQYHAVPLIKSMREFLKLVSSFFLSIDPLTWTPTNIWAFLEFDIL